MARLVLPHADGNALEDLFEKRFEVRARSTIGREVGFLQTHPAADINADGGRNDRILRRDDRTDRCAHADVHVGHGGDMVENKRKRRDVEQLRLGSRIDLIGPDMYGYARPAQSFKNRHFRLL